MSLRVDNTSPSTSYVTLFGKFEDGSYMGQVMNRCQVPKPRYWKNSVDEFSVYIEPSEDQLNDILDALNDGRLYTNRLKEAGSAYGGISIIEF